MSTATAPRAGARTCCSRCGNACLEPPLEVTSSGAHLLRLCPRCVRSLTHWLAQPRAARAEPPGRG